MNIIQNRLALGTIALAALLCVTFNSTVSANPGEQCNPQQISAELMHEHMKARLNKLAERLEIKSSQQTVWDEFAKSVDALADNNLKKPNDDADAATLARFHADRATEVAKKLNVIADATAKLQKILSDDQRKVFNQVSQNFLHKHHGCHWQGHEGHSWNQRMMER